MYRLILSAVCVLAVGSAFAQLPPDAVMLDKVKISEKIKPHELDPVTLEMADPSLPTWEHDGITYGSSAKGSKETFLKDPAKYAAQHDQRRWVLNFNESMSTIWCPVTDEISPGGNTIWEMIGYKWESCCQFCNDTKTDEDFPRALKRLEARALESYELIGGAKYTEGASSPVAGAINLGGPMPVETEPTQMAKAAFTPDWVTDDLEPTWAGGVGKVFENRCFECHRTGGAAPMEMTTVGQVRKWSKNLKTQIEQNNMPPWQADPAFEFANAKRLTQTEKDLILEWIAAGYPPGDGEFAPSHDWSEWAIGEPDMVVDLPEYTVPETARNHVREYEFTPEIDGDKWVVASEVRPTDSFLVMEINAGPLGAYYTGNGVTELPEGYGFRLKKGEPVKVRVFYTKEGDWEEFDDMSQIALKFADDPDAIEKAVHVGRAANTEFKVGAGEADVKAEAAFEFPAEGQLIGFTPIMRQRGKSISVSAGGDELLSVPRFDPNWKFSYHLVEPVDMAKGDAVTVTGTYDNSDMNAANPDPSATIRAEDGGEVLEAWVLYTVDEEKSAENRLGLDSETLAKATAAVACDACAAAGAGCGDGEMITTD